MHIKYSTQGLLIYAAIAAYLLTFLTVVIRLRKTSLFFFFAGFVVSCFAYGFRWYIIGRIPMQNLFEVFLFIACCIFPLSILCKKVLKTPISALDSLIGASVLFPAGFIFSEKSLPLPPALQSPLFIPHIAVYLLAYILMTKAAMEACAQVIGLKNYSERLVRGEEAAYRLVCASFPLLTCGLIFGCLWAQFAWADWWGWDPKEMWSLASWLSFAGYFFYRAAFGTKFPRLNSLWVITGFILILITLLWANLSSLFSGLHSFA